MDSQDSHECFHCGEEFSSATDFKVHLETHTKTAAPNPGVVGLTETQTETAAPSPGVVDLTDNGGEPHECFHCGAGFYSMPDLDNHMLIHNTAKTKTVITTSSEDTVITTPSEDTGGFVDLTEDGEDPNECFHCGEEFGSEDLLNSHLVTRHQVKPHRCVQCGDGFMHDYQLKAHELIHKDISPKVMSDVEMMYRSYTNNTRASTSTQEEEEEEDASTSQTEHESTSQTEHECAHCGKCFRSAGALSTHKLMHTAKQCHKCTYCTKIFIRPSDLKRHLVMHTGVKAHSCHLCPKKFSQTSALYQHMRQSHRADPHVCPYCGEGFDKMASLRVHKKSHLEDESYVAPYKKPYLSRRTEEGDLYKCAQCGDSFTEKTDLYVHSQIHMRDTLEICPDTGNGNFTLNPSQPAGDVVVTHKCPRCSTMFGGEAELNRHIIMCIPSVQDLSTHVKEENTAVNTLNFNNLGVVDLTLDDDDEDDVDQYKCTRCDKSFHLEVELNAHLIMFHSTADSTQECFHCGEEFDTEDNLKLHILTTHEKTGLKHHECPDCEQTFLLLSDFEDHKKQKHPVCTLCGDKFTKKSSLERHMSFMHAQHKKRSSTPTEAAMSSQQTEDMRRSAEVQWYKCLQCDQSFTSKPELHKHCRTHLYTPPKPTAYKCYCGMQFSNPDSLERHKETHSDVVDLTFDEDEIYKCSLCDDVYSREEELIVHMMKHPKQEPFECPECGKKFVFEKDYRFHLRTHVKAEGSKKRHVCSDCGKAFSQPGELKKHLLTHTGDKPHQCPVCQKRFTSLAVLQRHEATHGTEPHKCKHCGAGFWQIYFLQRHVENECSRLPQGTAQSTLDALVGKVLKTNTANKPSPISVNGSLVPQEAQGMVPQGIVAQVPPGMMPIKTETYTCCGWSFMSEADMKVHEMSHKVTVYKCVQCMQVFRSPADLDTHVKTHKQGGSPHKVPSHDDSSTSSTLTAPSTSFIEDEHHRCLQCGKEFRTEGFLNKHMQLHKAQLHKADKCHRCNECGQKFLSLSGLSRHALTHGDKKPNQCPVCNENFNNSAKLFEHMATHEGGKTHSCTQCGKTFKRSASLKSHMRMHTEEYGDGFEGDPSENVDMPSIHAPNAHRPIMHTPIIHTTNIPQPNVREPNGATPTPSLIDLTHVKQEEDEEEEDPGHMCTYCGRKFKHAKYLKSHFRTHMKSTSSTYYETKVKFADAAGKELRIVTRVRKKRCKCYICYKMFRRPSDLARHMMIHTGERPCKCAFCPEGFILLHGLKKHTMKFHKDVPPRDEDQIMKDKQEADTAVSKAKKAKKAKNISTLSKYGRLPGYLCCGIRFLTYLEIQHHWLVHKEEERYACPHCELKFTKGFSRTKHMMRMHSGTKPNCLDCGKEFTQFHHLIAHMKVHEAQMEDGEPASTNKVEVYTDVADGEPASPSRVEVYTDVADAGSILVKSEVIQDEEDEEDTDEVPMLPRLDNILHTAPDPLLLKREAGQHSETEVDATDCEVDPDIEVDPTDPDVDPTDPEIDPTYCEVDPGIEVAPTDPEIDPTYCEVDPDIEVNPTDPAIAPTDCEVDPDIEVDPTEPEIDPIALKKETNMDTTDDPSSPIDDAVLDSEPEENTSSLKKEAMMEVDSPSPNEAAVSDTGADVDPSSPNISIVS